MSSVELPDLNSEQSEIVPENIRATAAIYFAAQLEELKIFQVADSLVAHFQSGRLPIGSKNSARGLYQYWREEPLRLSGSNRKNLFARVLGLPGGGEDVVANRDFNDLWIRFVSSVSELARQDLVEETRATAEGNARTAGRELARNLSTHGFGATFFAAAELRKQIDQMVKLLSDREVQQAYGARDIWQVVDQVATLELGGSANAVRYRTTASSGATIIEWLAKNSRKLSPKSRVKLLNIKKPRSAAIDSARFAATKNPSDSDLVNACEKWLAVNNVIDDRQAESRL